jgi:K+-transporting ATPase ATPase C chain
MKHLRTSLGVLLVSTVVLGGLYPLLMTGVGALVFPAQVSGSLVTSGGKTVGSELIGQDFTSEYYFHSRPSAVGYQTLPSGAGNQGYTSKDLKAEFGMRKTEWEKNNATAEAPAEMLFASGSGLDPDISPRAAELQVPRVAAARGLDTTGQAALLSLVKSLEKAPQLGFLGESRVNVLDLNLALDREFPR